METDGPETAGSVVTAGPSRKRGVRGVVSLGMAHAALDVLAPYKKPERACLILSSAREQKAKWNGVQTRTLKRTD